MTALTALLVAAGGGLGAGVRFTAGHCFDRGFPTGTLAVNVLGSFLLGLVVAVGPGASALALLGTGFCGGLTTYSAFAVGVVGRGARGGSAYAVVTVVAALGACTLGWLLGVAVA